MYFITGNSSFCIVQFYVFQCTNSEAKSFTSVLFSMHVINMDKMAKVKLVRSPRENGEGEDAQKYLHTRTGRDEKKGKIQEKMERGSRKRSSSAGSEKMERVGGR